MQYHTLMNTQKSYKKVYIFVAALFFIWGFVTVFIDSLIPRFKEMFALSYFEAGLVRFAFFIPYLLFSIPMAFLLEKAGRRCTIILGLLSISAGCFLFYPAASERTLFLFLLAIFVLSIGITSLQVVANQYVFSQSADIVRPRKLILLQVFNALGTSIAPIVGAISILSDRVLTADEIASLSETEQEVYFLSEAAVTQFPFMVIAVIILLLAMFFAFAPFPKKNKEMNLVSIGEYFSLLKKQNLLLGSVAIFLYVGAEVSIGSFLVNYLIEINIVKYVFENKTLNAIIEGLGNFWGVNFASDDPKAIAGIFVAFYWASAMIGRLLGIFLSKIFTVTQLLISFSLSAITLILISINIGGLASMWCILAVGLFNSIMFPTIYTLASDGLTEHKSSVSGILCTMITGGAIVPPIFGFFVDNAGFKMAFLTLVVCYGFILFFGYYKRFVRA